MSPPDEFEVAGFEDREDMVYVVTIGSQATQKYADTMAERFAEMFDHAEFVLLGEDSLNVKTDDAVEFWQIDKERFKEVTTRYQERMEEDDG
jgi:hypothetical protein